VLSSECGGPSTDYGGAYTPEAHFIAVVHRNLAVLSADAAFCLWFRLGEAEGATYGNRFTALYDGSARPKPGVFAYRLLARLLDADATVRPLAAGGYEIARGDGGAVRVGWGAGAADVGGWAEGRGADAYCLADPSAGRLVAIGDASGGSCAGGAFVVAGDGLARILSLE
jgi:hypothetical protein